VGWIIIFMILGPLFAAAGAGAYWFAGQRERLALAASDPESKKLLDRAAGVKARVESGKALALLPSATQAGFRSQIQTAVDRTLPELIRRKAELAGVAARSNVPELEREVAALERKAAETKDPQHATVVSQSLAIAKQRVEAAQHLATLLERTSLQIAALVSGLEGLEERLAVTGGTAAPQLEALAGVDGLMTDLKDMETELARLDSIPRIGP
jgi:hypothetical protein